MLKLSFSGIFTFFCSISFLNTILELFFYLFSYSQKSEVIKGTLIHEELTTSVAKLWERNKLLVVWFFFGVHKPRWMGGRVHKRKCDNVGECVRRSAKISAGCGVVAPEVG